MKQQENMLETMEQDKFRVMDPNETVIYLIYLTENSKYPL